MEAGVRGKIVDLPFFAGNWASGVGFAGPVVENVYFGAGVIDDDQIDQAIAIEVRGMKE